MLISFDLLQTVSFKAIQKINSGGIDTAPAKNKKQQRCAKTLFITSGGWPASTCGN